MIIRTVMFLLVFTVFSQKSFAQIDGPYVFVNGGKVISRSITSSGVVEDLNPKSIAISFDGHPDWNFKVELKQKLQNVTSVYPEPKKIFAVSDIEGEFEIFRDLLIENKVIDRHYRWTFGKGSLVVCGDLFDRGERVTEFLWMLYLLEQRAEVKGGCVHVILGNHDIMNLSGDLRYVKPKYFKTAKALGMDYAQLFDEHTELGRWLRSKNIVEKIGSQLFLHAGISPEILATGKSVEQINQQCRPFYATEKSLIPDSLNVFFGKAAPFWYRGYFMQPRATMSLVDLTLDHFGCNRIIVGHTILARNMALYYQGKVLGIDVDYHEGKSGAALYENGKWRIVNAEGIKTDLVYRALNDVIEDKDIL